MDASPEDDRTIALEQRVVQCAREIEEAHLGSAEPEVRRALKVTGLALRLLFAIRDNHGEESPPRRADRYLDTVERTMTEMLRLQYAMAAEKTDDRVWVRAVAQHTDGAASLIRELIDTYSRLLSSRPDEERLSAAELRFAAKLESIFLSIDELASQSIIAPRVVSDLAAEKRTATILRFAAVLTLVTVSLIAGRQLFWPGIESNSAMTELLKLFITIPLSVLAGYLARESSKHRSTAQRLSGLRLQLDTLNDFTKELPSQDKGRYRYELGMRIYSTYAPPEPERTDEPAIEQQLVASLERLVDVIRSSIAARS